MAKVSQTADLTYKYFMNTTYQDWADNTAYFIDYIDNKLNKGKFSEAEVKAIYAHRQLVIDQKIDAAKANGTYKETSQYSNPSASKDGIVQQLMDDYAKLKSSSSGSFLSNKVVLVVGGLILFIIILSGGRR